MTPDKATIAEVEAMETQRCAAVAAQDAAALTSMFAPDMLFVHFRGKTEGGDDYIAAVLKTPRSIDVGPMRIEQFGDTVVMLGKHDINRYNPDRVIEAFGTRVLRKTEDGWKFVLIQVSPSVV